LREQVVATPSDINPKAAQLPIIIRAEPAGTFSAQAVGIPEIHASASTAAAALEQVRQTLAQWPGSVQWVAVPGSAIPPAAGHAKDDPDFDAYLEEIGRYRREVEARECSSSSSTPTT